MNVRDVEQHEGGTEMVPLTTEAEILFNECFADMRSQAASRVSEIVSSGKPMTRRQMNRIMMQVAHSMAKAERRSRISLSRAVLTLAVALSIAATAIAFLGSSPDSGEVISASVGLFAGAVAALLFRWYSGRSTRRSVALRAKQAQLVAQLSALESAAQSALYDRDHGIVSSPIKLREELQEAGIWTQRDVETYDRVLRLRNRIVHGGQRIPESDVDSALQVASDQLSSLEAVSRPGGLSYEKRMLAALKRTLVRIAPNQSLVFYEGGGRDRGSDISMRNQFGKVLFQVKYFQRPLVSDPEVRRLLKSSPPLSGAKLVIVSNAHPTEEAYSRLLERGVTWLRWLDDSDDDILSDALHNVLEQPPVPKHASAPSVIDARLEIVTEKFSEGSVGTRYLLVLRNAGNQTARDIRFNINFDNEALRQELEGFTLNDEPDLLALAPHSEARFTILWPHSAGRQLQCVVSWIDEAGRYKQVFTLGQR